MVYGNKIGRLRFLTVLDLSKVFTCNQKLLKVTQLGLGYQTEY